MPKKEKLTKAIRIVIQPSLYEKLSQLCDKKYTTVSIVIRNMIINYLKENNEKDMRNL